MCVCAVYMLDLDALLVGRVEAQCDDEQQRITYSNLCAFNF